jgi:hypothetical protein
VIRDWTPKLAKALKVVGLINIQYCVQDNQVSAHSYCPLCSPYDSDGFQVPGTSADCPKRRAERHELKCGLRW